MRKSASEKTYAKSKILINNLKNLKKMKLHNFNKIIGIAWEKAEYLKGKGRGQGLKGEMFKEKQSKNPGFIIKNKDETNSWKILFLNELESIVSDKEVRKNIVSDKEVRKNIKHLIGKYSYYFLKWHYDNTGWHSKTEKSYFDNQYMKLIKTIDPKMTELKGGSNETKENQTKETPMGVGFGLTGVKIAYNKDIDEIFKTLEEFMRDGKVEQLKKVLIKSNNKKSIKYVRNIIREKNKKYTNRQQSQQSQQSQQTQQTQQSQQKNSKEKWIYRGKRLPQKGEIVERIHSELNNYEWKENKIEDWKIKEDLANLLEKKSSKIITFKKYFDVYLPSTKKMEEIKKKIIELIEQNIEIINEKYTSINSMDSEITLNNLKKLLPK